MKKNICILGGKIFIAASIASGFAISEASAFGMGIYGGVSSSTADITVDTATSSTLSKDAGHKSFGMILDSAVAKDKLYNNRFQIGLDQFTLKPGQGGSTYDLKGIVFSNDFGFGLVRSEHVRFWIGPELRASILSGKDKNSAGTAIRDAAFVGFGVGPVFGLNINIGSAAALCLKGGYLFSRYSGYGTGTTSFYSNADYKVKENSPFINLGVIFRMGND